MFLMHDRRLAFTWPEAIHMTDEIYLQIREQVIVFLKEYEIFINEFILEQTITSDCQHAFGISSVFDSQDDTL